MMVMMVMFMMIMLLMLRPRKTLWSVSPLASSGKLP